MADYKQVPVWIGGNGTYEHMTVARTEGEALNNICEKDPILRSIGLSVRKLEPVDGCKVVALVPKGYQYGDVRRANEVRINKRKADVIKKEIARREAEQKKKVMARAEELKQEREDKKK